MNPIAAELDKLQKVCRNAKDITGETLDLYAEELADLPPDQVIAAIRELRKSSVFFPALSEIRNRVVQIVAGTILVDAEASWGEVLREIRRVGTAGLVTYFRDGEWFTVERQFSSPLIARAVEAIGWQEVCTAEVEQMGTLRAQFRDALKAIQRREVDMIVSGRVTDGTALTGLDAGTVHALPRKAMS